MLCPLCNKNRSVTTVVPQVYRCNSCGSLFGQCYLGDSYSLVKPFFVKEEPAAEAIRYFDLECVGSKGIERRHGWYDPASKLIVQVG
jgi:hypothetical protein